jgi:hypothetical protein
MGIADNIGRRTGIEHQGGNETAEGKQSADDYADEGKLLPQEPEV